jgi:hypothetical protein
MSVEISLESFDLLQDPAEISAVNNSILRHAEFYQWSVRVL